MKVCVSLHINQKITYYYDCVTILSREVLLAINLTHQLTVQQPPIQEYHQQYNDSYLHFRHLY